MEVFGIRTNVGGTDRAGLLHSNASGLMCADLFRSENLVVRHIGGFSRDRLVITFSPYDPDVEARQGDVPGFGEDFFRNRGVDAVHFIPRDNDWYQYPEFASAAELARQITYPYRKVVTYGSSMGAYAAIRFGRAVGASEAIAISPQFSIDPQTVPFEQRWSLDAVRIDFAPERSWMQPFVARSYVVYDPYLIDRQHVELFRPHTELVDVRIINGGHATWLLSDLGLLERLIFSVLDGNLDPPAFQRAVHARRREAPRFFFELSQKARSPSRRAALALRAHEMAPQEITYLVGHGLALAGLGRISEAKAMFERARRMTSDDTSLLYQLSFVFEWAGDWEAAVEAVQRLVDRRPKLRVAHEARIQFLEKRIADEAEWRVDIRNRAALGYPRRVALGYPRRGSQTGRSNRKRFLNGVIAKLPLAISRRLIMLDGDQKGIRPATAVPVPPDLGLAGCRDGGLIRCATRPVDLLLIGDGLAEYWDAAFWHPLSVFNMGVMGSLTQHALWGLRQLRERIDARCALVMVGGNNLAAGDPPEDIATGVRAIVREVGVVSPSTPCLVIEIPPNSVCAAQEAQRLRLNELLARDPGFATINVDAISDPIKHALIGGGEAEPAGDKFRHSDAGYRVLTRLIIGRLDQALPPRA